MQGEVEWAVGVGLDYPFHRKTHALTPSLSTALSHNIMRGEGEWAVEQGWTSTLQEAALTLMSPCTSAWVSLWGCAQTMAVDS